MLSRVVSGIERQGKAPVLSCLRARWVSIGACFVVALALLSSVPARAATSGTGCDFDGDGYGDVAIGSPYEAVGNLAEAGMVNVVYGSADGLTGDDDRALTQDAAGVLGAAEVGDRFGSATACGDFDGDGYADLVVSAVGEGIGSRAFAGAIHIFRGGRAGITTAGDRLWHQATLGVRGAAEVGDGFGSALAVGDYDGDGHLDLAVAVLWEDVGSVRDAGAVQVFYGTSSGLSVAGDTILSQRSAGVYGQAEALDEFGAALASGDFDGDGRTDLAVGVPGEDIGRLKNAGSAVVFFGTVDGLTGSSSVPFHQNSPGIPGSPELNDRFGAAMAAGDFDADGIADLVVAAPGEALGDRQEAGTITVLHGASAGLGAVKVDAFSQSTPGVAGVAEGFDRFGTAMAAADFDGDGVDDLAIGAPFEATGTTLEAGVVHVLVGQRAGGLGGGALLISQGTGGVPGAAEAYDRFGWALETTDSNGDGRADLLIAASLEGLGTRQQVGGITIAAGSAAGLDVAATTMLHQNTAGIAGTAEAGDRFGYSLGAVWRPHDEIPMPHELWSNPATWGGAIPQSGDEVVVPNGRTIILDVPTPPLDRLTVDGSLVLAGPGTAITSDSIIVRGTLRAGSVLEPFAHNTTITLTGSRADISTLGAEAKALMVPMGGRLELHGRSQPVTWTRLGETAQAGTTGITLDETVNWRVGDEFVIASTDYNYDQAEVRTVRAVSGSRITFNGGLEYEHWGALQSFGGIVLDERAEVGLLSRSVVVRGDDGSGPDGFGGHTMVMAGARPRISHTEFTSMGQMRELGRYPIHFHRARDMAGSLVIGNSVHHSFNRCVTVHGTHNVLVKDNVAYDAPGHCYFLEDGNETGNRFIHNLGLSTREPDPEDALLVTDHDHHGPATFWITNPDNVFIDNAAAGSDGSGFWIALPEHPTGPSATSSVWPRRTPLAGFRGNTAHSNGGDGLHVDNGPTADLRDTDSTNYRPVADPSDPESAPVVAYFRDVTAYKNRNRGVWLRGSDHVLRGAALADNAIGATFASDDTIVDRSLIVGESANLGTPASWEDTGLDGRSLPTPWEPDLPIQGFEFYDGVVGAVDTHFAGFTSNALRKAGALAYLRHTDFTVSPDNYAEDLTFASGTNRVWLETLGVPTDPEDGADGYRSGIFHDVDGSVSGSPGRTIVVNNPFLYTSGDCSYRSSWNARICDLDYSGVSVDDLTGGGGMGPLTYRRSDGVTYTLIGTPDGGTNRRFATALISDREYHLTLGGSMPDEVRLRLRDASPGEWVIIAIDGVTDRRYLYRDYWRGSGGALSEFSKLAGGCYAGA